MKTLHPASPVLALLTVLCSIVSVTHATAQEPPPAVPGVFNGQAGSVSQGVASASLPMVVPPGRGGVQPSLALRYAAGGLGDAGMGMSLAVPAIERQALSGPPQYADPKPGEALVAFDKPARVECKRWEQIPHEPGSPTGQTECVEEIEVPGVPGVDRFLFGGEPLVPICSLAEPDGCPKDEAMPSWASTDGGWHYYRLQHDSYTRFFWSPQGLTWRVIDKSGITSEYGQPLVAKEISASAIDFDDAKKKPFRWLLARTFDAVRDGTGAPVNLAAYRWFSYNRRSQLGEIFYTPHVKDGGGVSLRGC